MKHLLLKCSLCCNKTFETKLALTKHLKNILANLTCPVCNNRWSSLAHLIEHLTLDECQPDYSLIDYTQTDNDNATSIDNNADPPAENTFDDDKNESMDITEEKLFTISRNEISEDDKNSLIAGGHMYLEIDTKDRVNTCPPTQELKLVSSGECLQPFVVMSAEDTDINLENVVTKQNSDGTISLQTIKDLKLEAANDSLIVPTEIEPEDNPEELYSCNTCGVSFASVLEHIHSYHNDQVVVVEESLNSDISLRYDQIIEDPIVEKPQPVKRVSVITENGDIVDAVVEDPLKISDPLIRHDEVDKTVRQPGKRFVQVDKFCDSVVKTISPQENGGPYHKVIVKEMQSNGERVKTYFCMSCNINVNNLDDFKNQPCKIYKYPCPHCPVAYENSKSLCAHMKVHKIHKTDEVLPPVASEYYKCEICNTMFTTNKSLKLHKRMHDPIKSRPIEPPIETSQGTEGCTDRYHCSICDKMIPIDYRAVHQNSHKADDHMNCMICNKKFHSTECLEMHMSVHNLDKVPTNKSDKSLPYSCLYCDRRFARPHEKVKHERIHTGEKPHSCEICGKSFRVAYCLTLHMRTHTGARPYACPLCGKRFKAHSVYNHHLLTHSEVRRYKCPYCPKAFKTSVQLAGHRNSHTKPFSCTHCNRPFASLYAVRVHTETHLRQNNLKFACSLCGARYARAFALKDHFKQVHHQDVDTATLTADSLAKNDVDWSIKQVAESSEEVETIIDDKTLTNEITDTITDEL